MTTQFGIDALLSDSDAMARLSQARTALVANPASVTLGRQHSLDALIAGGARIVKAFGPQHGMRGDKQDNMIESKDYVDPEHDVPIISLYGEYRRPTPDMLTGVDIVVFDLQDVGCRIYTYNALLRYFLEALDGSGTELWVLDRPNPAGRPVDGMKLEAGEESIVGFDEIVTRPGLTVGEIAAWIKDRHGFDLELRIVGMQGYQPELAPGFGWPVMERAWINPSPNAASLNMSRCFPGTVLLEGTELSEGRGTTVPLEVIGAPDFPAREVLALLERERPDWTQGVFIRHCWFEPTFHKHCGQLCEGLQIHTDFEDYDHDAFTPYRFIAGLLKCLRMARPDYALWRHHDYEYEPGRTPIDVINGGPGLRQWVDDPRPAFDDLESRLDSELDAWLTERQPFLMY